MSIETRFKHNDLNCIVLKNIFGFRCGYVGVPNTHALYNVNYTDPWLETYISVHGGITFSAINRKFDIDNNQNWWFGFDCMHPVDKDNPKTLDFCINECKLLADQINLPSLIKKYIKYSRKNYNIDKWEIFKND